MFQAPTEFHEEHHEHLAAVGMNMKQQGAPQVTESHKDSLEEMKHLIKNIPIHTFVHFLALIYGSTMISLVTDMSPAWMVGIIATVSMGMFYHFKL